jgi:hypothetical protein
MATGLRAIWLLVVFAALAMLGGCWSHRAGSSKRLAGVPTYPAADAWPARDIEVAREAMVKTGFGTGLDVGVVIHGPRDAAARDRSQTAKAPKSLVRFKPPLVLYAGLHGQGLVRMLDEYDPRELRDTKERREAESRRDQIRESVGFDRNGMLLTSRTLEDPIQQVTREAKRGYREMILEIVSAEPETRRWALDNFDSSLSEGVSFRVPPRDEVARTPPPGPRGLLIHLHSLAPNPFEPRTMRAFRERGWIVVDIATQSSVLPALTSEQRNRLERLRERVREHTEGVRRGAAEDPELKRLWSLIKDEPSALRFHKRMAWWQDRYNARNREFDREMNRIQRERAFQVPADPTEEQIDASAREIAAQVDNSLAGNAYALEAVLEYIQSQREDLRDLPRAVIAFSAGALTAPTSIARVRERFPMDATVLIGGGADMFLLSQESSLTDAGVRIRTGKARTPRKVRELLHEAYLRQTRLDPLRTASVLGGVPVLQLHARFDSWVPSEGGELLWEALGRPERWDARLGHLSMFFVLPWKADEIVDWLDGHVARPDGAKSEAPSEIPAAATETTP